MGKAHKKVPAEYLAAVAEVEQENKLDQAAKGKLTDRGGREIGPLQGKGGSSWRYRNSN